MRKKKANPQLEKQLEKTRVHIPDKVTKIPLEFNKHAFTVACFYCRHVYQHDNTYQEFCDKYRSDKGDLLVSKHCSCAAPEPADDYEAKIAIAKIDNQSIVKVETYIDHETYEYQAATGTCIADIDNVNNMNLDYRKKANEARKKAGLKPLQVSND